MRKTLSAGGTLAYAITIKTIFTADDFITALSEHSLDKPIDYDNLSKKEAKDILFAAIPWNGRMGKFQGLDDIGYKQDALNEEGKRATKWVKKNYPYLFEKNN